MRLIQCPECHSTDIRYFESRNRYSCNNCGCGFSDQNHEAKKLRIFISYGHDNNEELVRLIRTDLEKRGHDVWFDKNKIKFGDEWRRSITEGIVDSHRILSFLLNTLHAIPGYVLMKLPLQLALKGAIYKPFW